MSDPIDTQGGATERISRRTACVLLAVIIVVAAYLRLRGYDALLPYASLPDARAIVQQVELIRSGVAHPELDPNWAYYSLFVARIVAMLPAPDPSKARSLEEHLACASLVLAQVRLLSIWISILAVPATYLLARRFLDRLRSVFASGLVATCLMHCSLSAAEKPHAIVTTFVLLGMLAALRLQRKPSLGSFALVGTSGAAALGALQNGLMILPAFVAAHVLRARTDQPARRQRARAWIGVGIAIAILAVGWWWLWPARAAPVSQVTQEPEKFTITLTGQAIRLSHLDGTGAVRMVSELWGTDPLLVLLSAIGLVGALVFGLARTWRARTWRPLAVVLACVVPYALLTGLYEMTAGRYVLPLIPFIACLAASAIPRRFAAPAFVLLIVPLAPAWRMAELRASPDTLEEASAYIAAHVPPEETIILIPPFDMPLFSDDASARANGALPWAMPWDRYQAALDPSWIEGTRRSILLQPSSGTSTPRLHPNGDLSYFREHGARWVVVSCGVGPHELVDDMATLRAQAHLVARISPLVHDDGRVVWMPPTDPERWPGPFPRAWRMFMARTTGPTIEIFRL